MASGKSQSSPQTVPVTSPLLEAERYAVVGAGVSGLAAVRMLLSLGKQVRLLDDKDAGGSVQVAQYGASGVELVWGPFTAGNAADALKEIERIVVSPGVGVEHALLETAERLDIPVYPEIELAWLRSNGARTVAVTGTNGKTTVTMLIRHLIEQAGLNGVETGNIGHPFSDAVREAGERLPETVFAAELSSFQLETVHDFRPDVAVLLNVTPDHLDRHGTMERYSAAKARITENQGPDEVLVVNQDDAECLRIAANSRARILRYSLNRPVEAGAWLDDDQLVWAREGAKPKRLVDLNDIPLFGMHNVENCLAAACAALALELDRKKVAAGLRSFAAPPHRLQPVGVINDVQYVNDSKATNIDATIKALTSFNQPIHLVAGGRDKNIPFAAARPHVKGRVARAYLIGECAKTVADAWQDATEILHCGTMERALEEASTRALPGEVVLLSPGCASFDQFRSYAHRGDVFTQWVTSHAEPRTDPLPAEEGTPS